MQSKIFSSTLSRTEKTTTLKSMYFWPKKCVSGIPIELFQPNFLFKSF